MKLVGYGKVVKNPATVNAAFAGRWSLLYHRIDDRRLDMVRSSNTLPSMQLLLVAGHHYTTVTTIVGRVW